MIENEMKGAVNAALGQTDEAFGEMTGDVALECGGAVREMTGDLQAGVGEAQAGIDRAAERMPDGLHEAGGRASALVGKVADKATAVYDRAASSARKAGDTIEPFVHDRPYAALGIAAGVGFVLAALMLGRGPKVVYIRQPH